MVKWFLIISNNNTYFTFMVRIPILSTSVTPTDVYIYIIITLFFFHVRIFARASSEFIRKDMKRRCYDQPLGPAMWGCFGIPSGKLLHDYGKSPCYMGKSTISMAIFNSYVNQRVNHQYLFLFWDFGSK